jgi:hypothetical protein
MLHRILITIFVLKGIISFTQTKSFEWKKYPVSYQIDSLSDWQVDVLENVFIFQKNIIHKYDSVGVFKFSESQKRIGKIAELSPINAMKFWVFSEEQQLICSLDNTLTNLSDCIELGDLDCEYVTKITASSQPNKVWIFDQVNFNLLFYSISGTNQNQRITNLNQTLGLNQLDKMEEFENRLFLFDKEKGVYVLDIYGTLIQHFPIENATSVLLDSKFIAINHENKLKLFNYQGANLLEIPLPEELKNVKEIKKVGDDYFFRVNNQLFKYRLVLN